MGKVVNKVKLAILSQSEPHFEGKRWKNMLNDQNWPFWANLSHFFGKICHCLSFWVTSVWNKLKKLKNSKNLPMYPPKPWKFLRFLQKWDALVAKDGKSCELGEIGHSKSIWASFWGKRWKNMLDDQNWPFWANVSHFFGKIHHYGSFGATSVWNNLKKLKNSKICQCTPPPKSKFF